MEKMRLTLEELEVQSFATSRAGGEQRGTVRGHDAPTDQVECPTANGAWDTCWDSCACHSEGNTGDCTVICYTDACGGGGGGYSGGSFYFTMC
ncbi:MAG: pinensin family lanthipeptide [Longimicrobiaceae bacterium]